MDKKSQQKEKDNDALYSELLTAKLRNLSQISKLRAKHKIDNIMFKCLLSQEENSMASSYSSSSDFHQRRSINVTSPTFAHDSKAVEMNQKTYVYTCEKKTQL